VYDPGVRGELISALVCTLLLAACGPARAADATPTPASAPTSTPPTVEQPTPAPSPPPPSPTPTPDPRSPAALQQQLQRAESQLRSGELEAAIDYADGNSSVVTLRFDLGDPQGPSPTAPRLQSVATYHSGDAERSVERVTWADRSWQRQEDQPWRRLTEEEGVWGQLQVYLPQAATAANPTAARAGDGMELRWFEPARSADVSVQMDPTTGIPTSLRRVPRGGGPVFSVAYRGWNTPVDIQPPSSE
jgi:hypothetical protein